VSFNELKSLQPGSLRGLSSLQNLRLSNNHFVNLSSVIPALADLPELRTLSLDENALGRIEANDFLPLANSSLETLDLNNCDIRYISPEAFLPLTRLRHLILSTNIVTNDNLVHVFHTMQDHQSGLKAVSLSGFNFAGSPPRELLSVLSKMDVKQLDLSKNTLPTLNNVTFPLMANVLELDLNSCGIISIENGSFDHFPSLRRLNLAFNRLGQIPAAVASLDQLQWLSLSENSGRGELDLVDNQLSAMIHLTYLICLTTTLANSVEQHLSVCLDWNI
jgi:Leucine-rich repeat (LRR) protein